MTDRPIRIQLRRTKGWKMPPNTVCVTRGPGRIFGNPFTVEAAREAGYHKAVLNGVVVECFANWLRGDRTQWMGQESDATAALILSNLGELRGKNLACFCPLDQPCHADVLLEIANAEH